MFALSGWTQIAVFCAYGETQEYCISLINLVLVNAGHLQWSFANGYKRREFTITILSWLFLMRLKKVRFIEIVSGGWSVNVAC